MSGILSRLSAHWERGKRYARRRDWIVETYHRVMSNLTRGGFPRRNKVVQIFLRDDPRPFFLRLGSSDFTVLNEIFDGREYDDFLSRLPGEIKMILDLGANAGLSVRLWQSRFPHAKIIAVEPDADSVRVATLNAGPGVVMIQACVAGSSRKVSLDRTGGAWMYRMTDATDGDAIDALTVPQIMDRAGSSGSIDLLKCDVEGAEQEIFANCADWIGRVRNMVVEIHPPYSSRQLQLDLHKAGATFDVYEVANPDGHHVVMFFGR